MTAWKYIPILSCLFLASSGWSAVSTNGLIVNLDAADNPGHGSGRWDNLGSLGGHLLPPNAGQMPVLMTDTNASYYSSPANQVWGREPSVGTEPAIHIEDWSFECWIRRIGNGSGEHQILGMRNTPAADNDQRIELTFQDTTSDSLLLRMKGQNAPGGNTTYVFNNVATVPIGDWVQLVFSFNDATDQLKTYVNGAPQQTLTAPVSIDFDPSREMKRLSLFVAFAPESGRHFNGHINVFRLYDRVLTDTEVDDNFQAGISIDPVDPPDPDPGSWIAELVDTNVTPGTVVNIQGPPSTARDTDTTGNSIALAQPLLDSRKAIPGGAFETAEANWMTTQNPTAGLATISSLVQQNYDNLISTNVHTPIITQVDFQYFTYIYPTGYFNNGAPVTVRSRRFTIFGTDQFGAARTLVGYYVNYDKLDPDDRSVIFQINGHFGSSPSRLGLGLHSFGGLFGAALGKIAMQGYPLITYDDHDVGESSGSTGTENGLYRTLANLETMDHAILEHFGHVDGMGLSGGTERLYHFLFFHECQLSSAYLGGFAVPIWTQMDTAARTGGPFGSNQDTDNVDFQNNFQWADMALVGINKGIPMTMTHNAYEGGRSKYGFFVEMRPALLGYVGQETFEIRGGDLNGDGNSESGRWLSHEYDLVDFFDWIEKIQFLRTPGPQLEMLQPGRVGWLSKTDRIYQVQYSDSLVTPVWINLGNPVAGDGTSQEIVDSALSAPNRIYRILSSRI